MLLLEKHYDDAIRHFHLAMSLGCSEGSYNLATLYEGGVGGYTENELGMLNQDHQMAIKYYKWAADQVRQWYGKRCKRNIHLINPPPSLFLSLVLDLNFYSLEPRQGTITTRCALLIWS